MALFKAWRQNSREDLHDPLPPCKRCPELQKQLENAKVALVLADRYGETLTKAREKFVHKLADQIRLPLHGIIGLCSSLMMSENDEKVGTIKQTSEQILTTINELLQIATIESGRMCMENVSFDPRRLLSLTLKLLAKKIGEKEVAPRIDINVSVPKTLAGDVSRLRQCLFAIIDTLLEESNPGDILDLNMQVLSPDDPLLGTMPRSKRYIPCLYELKLRRPRLEKMLYTETENETEPLVVLSAELAQGMGGRLMHSSSYTAFQMVAYFRSSIGGPISNPSLRYSTSRDPVTEGKKFTLLIYEENPVFLKSICKPLATQGHTVDIVKDVNEIQQLVTSGTIHQTYDCVIVDTSEKGFRLVESLRETEREAMHDKRKHDRLTILLTLTNGLETWNSTYESSGVNGYFLKPCGVELIISRVTDAISAVHSLVSLEEGSESQSSSNSSVQLAVERLSA